MTPPGGAPDAHSTRRASRRRVLVLVASVAALAFTISLATKPAPIVGVTGTALSNSLEDEMAKSFSPISVSRCTSEGSGAWKCEVETDPGSNSGYTEELEVDGSGCWTARPFQRHPEHSTAKPITMFSGCVGSILDYWILNP